MPLTTQSETPPTPNPALTLMPSEQSQPIASSSTSDVIVNDNVDADNEQQSAIISQERPTPIDANVIVISPNVSAPAGDAPATTSPKSINRSFDDIDLHSDTSSESHVDDMSQVASMVNDEGLGSILSNNTISTGDMADFMRLQDNVLSEVSRATIADNSSDSAISSDSNPSLSEMLKEVMVKVNERTRSGAVKTANAIKTSTASYLSKQELSRRDANPTKASKAVKFSAKTSNTNTVGFNYSSVMADEFVDLLRSTLPKDQFTKRVTDALLSDPAITRTAILQNMMDEKKSMSKCSTVNLPSHLDDSLLTELRRSFPNLIINKTVEPKSITPRRNAVERMYRGFLKDIFGPIKSSNTDITVKFVSYDANILIDDETHMYHSCVVHNSLAHSAHLSVVNAYNATRLHFSDPSTGLSNSFATRDRCCTSPLSCNVVAPITVFDFTTGEFTPRQIADIVERTNSACCYTVSIWYDFIALNVKSENSLKDLELSWKKLRDADIEFTCHKSGFNSMHYNRGNYSAVHLLPIIQSTSGMCFRINRVKSAFGILVNSVTPMQTLFRGTIETLINYDNYDTHVLLYTFDYEPYISYTDKCVEDKELSVEMNLSGMRIDTMEISKHFFDNVVQDVEKLPANKFTWQEVKIIISSKYKISVNTASSSITFGKIDIPSISELATIVYLYVFNKNYIQSTTVGELTSMLKADRVGPFKVFLNNCSEFIKQFFVPYSYTIDSELDPSIKHSQGDPKKYNKPFLRKAASLYNAIVFFSHLRKKRITLGPLPRNLARLTYTVGKESAVTQFDSNDLVFDPLVLNNLNKFAPNTSMSLPTPREDGCLVDFEEISLKSMNNECLLKTILFMRGEPHDDVAVEALRLELLAYDYVLEPNDAESLQKQMMLNLNHVALVNLVKHWSFCVHVGNTCYQFGTINVTHLKFHNSHCYGLLNIQGFDRNDAVNFIAGSTIVHENNKDTERSRFRSLPVKEWWKEVKPPNLFSGIVITDTNSHALEVFNAYDIYSPYNISNVIWIDYLNEPMQSPMDVQFVLTNLSDKPQCWPIIVDVTKYNDVLMELLGATKREVFMRLDTFHCISHVYKKLLKFTNIEVLHTENVYDLSVGRCVLKCSDYDVTSNPECSEVILSFLKKVYGVHNTINKSVGANVPKMVNPLPYDWNYIAKKFDCDNTIPSDYKLAMYKRGSVLIDSSFDLNHLVGIHGFKDPLELDCVTSKCVLLDDYRKHLGEIFKYDNVIIHTNSVDYVPPFDVIKSHAYHVVAAAKAPSFMLMLKFVRSNVTVSSGLIANNEINYLRTIAIACGNSPKFPYLDYLNQKYNVDCKRMIAESGITLVTKSGGFYQYLGNGPLKFKLSDQLTGSVKVQNGNSVNVSTDTIYLPHNYPDHFICPLLELLTRNARFTCDLPQCKFTIIAKVLSANSFEGTVSTGGMNTIQGRVVQEAQEYYEFAASMIESEARCAACSANSLKDHLTQVSASAVTQFAKYVCVTTEGVVNKNNMPLELDLKQIKYVYFLKNDFEHKVVSAFYDGRKFVFTSDLSDVYPIGVTGADFYVYNERKIAGAMRSFVPYIIDRSNVTVINGVAGCGKTTRMRELFNKDPQHTLYLSASRSSKDDLREQVSDSFRSHIRTIDSVIVNSCSGQFKTLLIDEAYLVHAGKILFVLSIVTPKKLVLMGDTEQLKGFNGYSFEKPWYYDDISKYFPVTELMMDSYRCPSDVCRLLTKLVYHDRFKVPMVSKSGVKDSLKVLPFKSAGDIHHDVDLILTFKRSEKNDLIKAGFKNVLTIHESQGMTRNNVVLVRCAKTSSALDSIYDNVRHIVVGLSRHKQSLTYYTNKPDDLVSKLINGVVSVGYDSRLVCDNNYTFIPPAGSVVVTGNADKIFKALETNNSIYYKPEECNISSNDERRLIRRAGATGKRLTIVRPKYVYYQKILDVLPKHVEYIMEDVYTEILLPTVFAPITQVNFYQCPAIETIQNNIFEVYGECDKRFLNEAVERADFDFPIMDIRFANTCERAKSYDTMIPRLTTPIQPRYFRSVKSELMAITKRNLNPPQLSSSLPPDIYALELFNSLKSLLIDTAFEPVLSSVTGTARWLQTQPGDFLSTLPDSEVLFDEIRNSYELLVKPNAKPTVDPKVNTQLVLPQTIAACDKIVTFVYSPIIRELKNRLMSILPNNMFLYTDCAPEEFCALLDDALDPAYTDDVLEIDIGKYDKSQSTLALLFEIHLFRYLGMPEYLVEYWYKIHVVTRLYSRTTKITVTLPHQRKSGDPATFFGNTAFLIAVMSTVVDLRSCHCSMFSGDDSLIFGASGRIKRPIVETLALKYNLEVKLLDYPGLYFCSKYLLHDKSHWFLVPDPAKVILKMGRFDIVNEEHLSEYAASTRDLVKSYNHIDIMYLLSDIVPKRMQAPIDVENIIAFILHHAKSDFKHLFYFEPYARKYRDKIYPNLDI